ncbi:hypothetical protein GLOIN_2v1617086 [Rhizophagus irregularis DAOM 181602=DAOM 197198]|uniref:Uncharacterized protein n=1 Tax=Rhizophagus irregularis (strain DAOM 181602 / DAOM 197198 / MUCL 43194) TaxID=747089 RepID=A0A2P4PYC1_RHIID|nr:hypothetical protein GLOIN_2v1617086 [Rhizophagus irregularis DAOM 181602=DAOM 197198]POG70360.1 hypothetical protein GLOIN_2v1617086 [Rhizophagus irregularis DAOM 181602=DAOM 197198]|eukprot:XP_025177226.1 hypothetical protein GLOIN_2v1617086 [Rhizophagus irregularis DAOM 181602=DAOM 197198]
MQNYRRIETFLVKEITGTLLCNIVVLYFLRMNPLRYYVVLYYLKMSPLRYYVVLYYFKNQINGHRRRI